jgi:glyoxylate/hydroxypyruvate reductase A
MGDGPCAAPPSGDRHPYFGQDGIWRPGAPPLARDRPSACWGWASWAAPAAEALAALNFRGGLEPDAEGGPRRALSRRRGRAGAVLARSEILVLLLPLTPATENLLNAARLARMPRAR